MGDIAISTAYVSMFITPTVIITMHKISMLYISMLYISMGFVTMFVVSIKY